MGDLPALTNAMLTAVSGPGFTEDYDDPGTSGSGKWTGTEEVLFSEQAERVQIGGSSNIIVARYVVVDAELDVPWEIGDVLTLTYDGDAKTVTVRRISKTLATGLDGVVRLVLDDA